MEPIGTLVVKSLALAHLYSVCPKFWTRFWNLFTTTCEWYRWLDQGNSLWKTNFFSVWWIHQRNQGESVSVVQDSWQILGFTCGNNIWRIWWVLCFDSLVSYVVTQILCHTHHSTQHSTVHVFSWVRTRVLGRDTVTFFFSSCWQICKVFDALGNKWSQV